jgi:hypothetical protein
MRVEGWGLVLPFLVKETEAVLAEGRTAAEGAVRFDMAATRNMIIQHFETTPAPI